MKLTQVVPTLPAALVCGLGASAQAQGSNWSITYAYQGTSSIQHNGGQVQEGSTGDGSFGAAQTLGAGGPWVMAGEFESKITVKAQWIGLGDPPAEQEFRIDSSTSSHGSASFAGSASNGLSSPSVSTDPTTLLCSGTSYVVSRPDAMGVCLMRFSVSGSASAIPVPFPGGWVLAATSNTLTVAPDQHAVMWRYQVEPTFYRKELASGQGVLALNETSDTQHRVATTSFKDYNDLLHWKVTPTAVDSTLYFDKYGFNWLTTNVEFTLGSPAYAGERTIDFVRIRGTIPESDLTPLINGNGCKTVVVSGTATDILSGVSRSADISLQFYPPQTIIRKSPWETVYAHAYEERSTWAPLSAWKIVDAYDAHMTVDSAMVVSATQSVTNCVTSSFESGLSEPFIFAAKADFTREYGEVASIAKEYHDETTYDLPANPEHPYRARIVANPYWSHRFLTCASYAESGYDGDFTAEETMWVSATKSDAERFDMVVAILTEPLEGDRK